MPASASNTLGIYVSVPFCRSKCTYCNFASGVFGSDKMGAYVERLVEQIRGTREKLQKWRAILPEAMDSIYFGGGTPSLLSAQQLHRILEVLHEEFRVAVDAEITLECAPGLLAPELLRALPGSGVNRVSLGVQSFVDAESRAVGRLHTRDVALEQIKQLRDAGIENINVDLIAGLPHQTRESWRFSLEQALACGVPHLSVYMLDVDEDSRLGREMLAGGERYHVSTVPSDAVIAEMYTEACETFEAARVAQYEISNFARAGWESRHNLKYWGREPYVGFGVDAHSYLETIGGDGLRIETTDDLERYLQDGPQEVLAPVSRWQAWEEAWFLGLRRNAGVSLAELEQRMGAAAMQSFAPVWRQCVEEGLLQEQGGRVRLTPQGRLFANEVFARFLGVLPETLQAQEVVA